MLGLELSLLHRLRQLRGGVDFPSSVARDEARVHNRAVLVLDRASCADVVARPVAAEERELRPEEEVRDSSLLVEVDYLAHDGERRVVQHRAAVGVVESLVVSARIERPHAAVGVDAVFAAGPILHGLVHLVGGVAVVGGELWLELLRERVVLVVRLASIGGERGAVPAVGPHVEAELRHVEIGQLSQLDVELPEVPARAHGQLVVHQRVESALLVRQAVQVYHGHALKPQLKRRHEPTVALHDLALALGVRPHPDGVAEAHLAHALLDLVDLLCGVRLGVSRVLLEPAYRLHRDLKPAHELLNLGRRQPLRPSHPLSFRPDHCRALVTGGRTSTSA